MLSRSSIRVLTGALTVFSIVGAVAYAIDGTDLKNKYAGHLVATQVNATGYGNASSVTQAGITVGSELDAMYVSADSENLWIGLTGNLPNQNANGQSIIIFLQGDANATCFSNTLAVGTLPGDGGGHAALVSLDGMVFDNGFCPSHAIVVNRAGSPNGTTYANVWDLVNLFEYPYTPDHVNINPYFNIPFPDGNYTSCTDYFFNSSDQACYAAPEPCLMSCYMDATNVAGVTDDETIDGTGPGKQEALASTAVKGLRVRLNRYCLGIGQNIKLMAMITSPDGNASNQILPPIPNGEDPAAPACYTPENKPNFQTISGAQFATLDLTQRAGTPTTPGANASDIPSGWAAGAGGGSLAGTPVAVQQLHTCYGNAVNGQITLVTNGSELDQLFARNDNAYLQVAFTGDLEGNGNKIYLFIDSTTGGENTLDDNGPQDTGENALFKWSGRTFDAGFAPDYCYVFNNFGGTLYIDQIVLATDTKTYLGSSVVGGGAGTLGGGGTNVNNDEFALDNSNSLGVSGDANNPGDASTATTGFEARIALSEIGVDLSTNPCTSIRAMVVLGNQTGEYLSNQFLPSLAAASANINNDPTTKFNFGSTDTGAGGSPAFAGNQYASANVRALGALDGDANHCLTVNDTSVFVQVILGIDTNAQHVCLSDVNNDGFVNGNDIQPFVQELLAATSPCP